MIFAVSKPFKKAFSPFTNKFSMRVKDMIALLVIIKQRQGRFSMFTFNEDTQRPQRVLFSVAAYVILNRQSSKICQHMLQSNIMQQLTMTAMIVITKQRLKVALESTNSHNMMELSMTAIIVITKQNLRIISEFIISHNIIAIIVITKQQIRKILDITNRQNTINLNKIADR